MSPLLTVEVVPGDDRRTALCIFVGGTVIGIVAALDASARATGFDKLDVVIVTQTDTALGVSMSAGTSAGIVLTSCIVRIQSAEFLWTDTSSDCRSGVGMSHRGGEHGEINSRWA